MTAVLRPAFAEGQILAATDLGATVDFPRGRAARHDRYLHEWGIAEGLTLTKEDRTDPDNRPYVAITVQPGVAIDGTGREIVVPDPVVLQESLFDEVNGADPASLDPYPVFLAGLDEDQTPVSLAADRCGSTSATTRVAETYQISFGKLGDQRRVPDPVEVGEGPGDNPERWPILIGYVIWDGTHIVDLADTDAEGIAPPRAGVRATVVAAPSGRLTLRSKPVADAATVLRIDDEKGLLFGTAGAAGAITELLSVNGKGDLKVRGTIETGPRRGDVVVASGQVSDGLKLPLPDGVDPARVRDKSVTLHVLLRPRPSPDSGSGTETWIDSTLDCSVDENLQVTSRVRAIRLDPGPVVRKDLSVPADYLLLAVTAEPSGGGQP